MKKILLSFGILLVSISTVNAQGNAKKPTTKNAKATTVATAPAAGIQASAPVAAASTSTLTPDNLQFKADTHDFGTVAEGPTADYTFTFKNTGKEPLLLQNVSASCGCTTPSWSKEPVLPGQEGTVKASFATQGRGGQPFTKTITVTSNAGTKVLTIKGEVEKAPDASVPQNNSLIKTN